MQAGMIAVPLILAAAWCDEQCNLCAYTYSSA
jgi:hypothetical protein